MIRPSSLVFGGGLRRLCDVAALHEGEQQPDSRYHEYDCDPEDDQHARESRARGGGVCDRELLGQQVGMLGDAPGPDQGGDRSDRERAGTAAGVPVSSTKTATPQTSETMTSGSASPVRPS